MNKKGNLSIYVFVVFVLFTSLITIYLLNTNSNKFSSTYSDVQAVLWIKQTKEENLLHMKMGFDSAIVSSYNRTMKDVAYWNNLEVIGLGDNQNLISDRVNAFEYFNITFSNYVSSYIKNLNGFDFYTDWRGTDYSYKFVYDNFSASSGVLGSLVYRSGPISADAIFFTINKEKVVRSQNKTILLFNYTAPLQYENSLGNLGLDSYGRIFEVFDSYCFSFGENYGGYLSCLNESLPNWQWNSNSISAVKTDDDKAIDYYSIRFISKRNYTEFSSPSPISFTLYVKP